MDWIAQNWRVVALVVAYMALVNQFGNFLIPAIILGGALACWYTIKGARRVRQMRKALPDSPWWRLSWDFAREERGRAAVKAAWARACEGQNLTSGKRTPGLYGLTRTPEGDFTAVVTSQAGVPVSKILGKTQELAEVMRFREVVVTPLLEGRARIEFRRSNPLARIVKPSDLKPAPKGHVPLGVRHDGSVASAQVLDRKGNSKFTPLLICAATGAGKSGLLHAFLAGLVAAEIPVRLHIYDGKGGVELMAYEPYAGKPSGNPLFQVAEYVTTMNECEAMLKRLDAARKERLEGQRTREFAPTVDEPLVLFICDEFKTLPKRQREVDSAHHLLMTLGRASAFSTIELTQIGTKEAIGQLRDAFDQRIALRTQNRVQTEMVLGDGAAEFAPAHLIPNGMRGMFYMQTDQGEMVKARAAYYDDDDVTLIAQGLLPRGMKAATAEPERKCAVYRFYSWDGEHQAKQLQYVGKAFDPAERYAAHKADARKDPHGKGAWWGEVQRFAAMDGEHGQEEHFVVRWYDSEADALAAEEAAIKAELPAQNVVHNHRNPIRVRRLRVVEDEAA